MHDTLLLFGATGDLACKHIFPSLANLWADRLLPDDFRVLAIARQALNDDSFRKKLIERTEEDAGASDFDPEAFTQLLQHTHYVSADLSNPASLQVLKQENLGPEILSYLATPPDLFLPIAEGLEAAGLLDDPACLMLEKPIGHDLQSARAVNQALRQWLPEQRIYRVDHYLGKATVQDLIALRFGNTLLEAVWSRRWIESVHILVAETVGVDGRESYYAHYGALRDMVQNHMLQLLCLIAMDPPSNLEADTLRDEKLKVLKALRPMQGATAKEHIVRGRYEAGVVGGRPVQGYALPGGQENIETQIALRTYIDNWRWAGVPFNLFTGKRMAERRTQVVVNFKPVSHWLFDRPSRKHAMPNRLVIRLQPEGNIELELMSSLAAPEWGGLELQPISLNLSTTVSRRRRIAYERLFLDALHGNPTLFVRGDEVEAAWSWIDSVIHAWHAAPLPVSPYMAGSWGPQDAARFLPGTISAAGRYRREKKR